VVIEGIYLRVFSLSFVSVVISVSSPFCCVRVLCPVRLYTHKGDGSF